MICNDCMTEAFAWMAEDFSCPACGSNEYVHPDDVNGMQPMSQKDNGNVSAASSSKRAEIIRKRKRSTSGGGRRKYSE
jgi:hypothetical protein